MRILGHEVDFNVDFDELSGNSQDDIIYDINQSILDGDESGSVTTREKIKVDWKIETELSYIDLKISILEKKDEVLFEHNNQIYKVILNSNDEYEYTVYDEELELLDGGCFECSAREVIEDIINIEHTSTKELKNSEDAPIKCYLKEKLHILQIQREVVLEYKSLSYVIFFREDGRCEYRIYDLRNFVDGDCLNVIDGGIFKTESGEDLFKMIFKEDF